MSDGGPGLRARLAAAVADGLVIGAKWGVALVMVGLLLFWAIADYAVVRERALHGQIAFETLQRASQQQSAGSGR